MSETTATAAIWYLVLTTVPSSGIIYDRPIGPLTEEQCQRAAAAVQWRIIIDKVCRKAVGYRTCSTSEIPYAGPLCPILEPEPIW